jgi:uncharacterized membrane protein
MLLYYISISLAIISNLFYYIIQKSTPGNVNPLLSLAVTYFTAMITCLLIFPFYPNYGLTLGESIRKLNWTSVALGVSIVGLETGFLLAFRSGWNLGTAGIFANVVVAILLIPVGLVFFKENLRPVNVAGIALCIVGLILMTKK